MSGGTAVSRGRVRSVSRLPVGTPGRQQCELPHLGAERASRHVEKQDAEERQHAERPLAPVLRARCMASATAPQQRRLRVVAPAMSRVVPPVTARLFVNHRWHPNRSGAGSPVGEAAAQSALGRPLSAPGLQQGRPRPHSSRLDEADVRVHPWLRVSGAQRALQRHTLAEGDLSPGEALCRLALIKSVMAPVQYVRLITGAILTLKARIAVAVSRRQRCVSVARRVAGPCEPKGLSP